MSKIYGIFVLVLGAALIGTGFGVNFYFLNTLEAQIPSSLKEARDEGILAVRKGVYEDYTADILLGVLNMVNETVDGEENLSYLINGTTATQTIKSVIDGIAVQQSITDAFASDAFMNDVNVEVDISEGEGLVFVKGISNYSGGSLFLTLTQLITILDGNDTANMPGIRELDADGEGTPGALTFLLTYLEVSTSGNLTLMDQMSSAYDDADFISQLGAVAQYLNGYLLPKTNEIISLAAGFTVPPCTPANSLDFIKLQWGTKALFSEGLVVLEPSANGFEISEGEFSSFQEIISLWNPSINVSVLNKDATYIWYGAAFDNSTDNKTTIEISSGLTQGQIEPILEWYKGDFQSLIKVAVESEMGITGDSDVFERLLYAQWSSNLLDEEDFPLYEFDDEDEEPITGFEMGLPIGEMINTSISLDLWDEFNTSSFLNETGIAKWLVAAEDQTSDEFRQLNQTFGLTQNQTEAICDWLLNWRDVVLPAIGGAMGELPSFPIYGTDLTKMRKDSQLYLPILGAFVIVLGLVLIVKKKD